MKRRCSHGMENDVKYDIGAHLQANESVGNSTHITSPF